MCKGKNIFFRGGNIDKIFHYLCVRKYIFPYGIVYLREEI